MKKNISAPIPRASITAIGDEIARQYAAGAQTYPDKDDTTCVETGIDEKGRPCFTEMPRANFRIGALTIRCADTPEAVACVVAKYRKAWTPSMGGMGKPRPERNAWPPGSGLQAHEIETIDD
jgi:hypothetical protein